MIRAYNERVIDLHQIARLQTFIIASPNFKKGYSWHKFCKDWPLGEEDSKKPNEELLNKARQLFNGGK